MVECLEVCVNDNTAGELYREGRDFIFRYEKSAQPEHYITLTMPVRVRDYVHDQLHPEKEGLFDELVQRFALQSPLSGVQPKVLAHFEVTHHCLLVVV